ncbi:MAG: calcium-binding protein [Rhodospirillales bacterium]
MGTYTGTSAGNRITPTAVSTGVTRDPAESRPSAVADTIDGLGGADTLDGGGGDDLIYGGTGRDRLYGRDGNDTIYGKTSGVASAADADTIYGGNGNDIIYGNGGEEDTGFADGNDTIYGNAGNDQLYGKLGNDTLNGGAGSDRLAAYRGNDRLSGGGGDDFLRGGDGLDRMSGGAGNDTYNYDLASNSPAGARRDVILDFNGVGPAAGDIIDLATLDANIDTPGNEAFSFIAGARFTAPGQVRVSDRDGDTLIQANTSGAPGAELEIFVEDGGATPGRWVAEDFIL